MNILNALKQLRDDIKTWVTVNLNALNAKIDEKTIPIDSKLDSTSTNPVQNQAITKEIDSINDRVGDTSVATQISNAIDKVPTFSGDYNDLTNAPDISEDGLGTMIIADESGNIIFKADADGVHTTAVSINGEAAATEKYVDEAISNIDIPEVDFTGYATETYVDNKVADLVNSAPEALDTLGELATALKNHEDAYDALLETVGSKATYTDLDNLKEELSESIVSEMDEFHIVDNAGNIVASIDENGVATTTVIAQSVIVNGNSVEEHIDDINIHVTLTEKNSWDNKVDKVEGKGLSTNDFTDAYKEKLDDLDDIVIEESDPTVPAWAKEATKPSYTADEVGALADTTVLADLVDDATHRTVTDTEKANWNAKSEFSGDYNDLENAPNITEDDTGDLIIADTNGNIIFRSNGDGFETTQINTDVLKVNNMPLDEIIDNALNPLIQDDENKSIREIAREEALKIETAAMEFMGTVTAFPTGLTANDKGHMYKVAKEFTVNNNISIPVYQEISAYDTNPVEIAIPAEYYEFIPESGKLYIDYQTLFDGNIQGDHKISVILDLDYFGEMYSTITVENGASYELGYGNVVTGARVVLEDQDSTGEENSTYGVTLNVKSVIFAQTVPVEMQGQTIKVGDTIIWDGYAWFVIPSGDDAGSVDIDDKLETLKAEILVELKAYIDETILNGAW